MTSNRAADQTQQGPDSGSPKVSTGSAVGGHDHLKDAPQRIDMRNALAAAMPNLKQVTVNQVADRMFDFLREGQPARQS